MKVFSGTDTGRCIWHRWLLLLLFIFPCRRLRARKALRGKTGQQMLDFNDQFNAGDGDVSFAQQELMDRMDELPGTPQHRVVIGQKLPSKMAWKGWGTKRILLQRKFRDQCDELFRQIDQDGDGQLSKKEISKGIEHIKTGFGLAIKAKAIFKAADSDGDKMLDADEFHGFMRNELGEQFLEQQFQHLVGSAKAVIDQSTDQEDAFLAQAREEDMALTILACVKIQAVIRGRQTRRKTTVQGLSPQKATDDFEAEFVADDPDLDGNVDEGPAHTTNQFS